MPHQLDVCDATIYLMEQLLSLLMLLLGVLLSGQSSDSVTSSSNSAPERATSTAEVVRVIDGDTIVVASGTVERIVRYIGIDAPERYRDRPSECFAAAATRANEELVAGQTVQLVPDVELTDEYGRDLRYVYVDGTFVNEALITAGYARTLPIPPNRTFARALYTAEQAAAAAGKGVWSACE